MKKLLSVLATAGVIGSSATSLVSCGVSSQSINLHLNGTSGDIATEGEITAFNPPSMQGTLSTVAAGVLNLLTISNQKVEDASDAKLLGDAKELSIDSNITDDKGYYSSTDDSWNSLKTDFRAHGNSRFTDFKFNDVDYKKVAKDGPSQLGKLQILAVNYKDGSLTVNDEIKTGQDFYDKGFTEGTGDTADGNDTLKGTFGKFNKSLMPYGEELSGIKFKMVDNSEANPELGTWTNLDADYLNGTKEIPVGVKASDADSPVATTVDGADADSKLLVQELDTPITFAATFVTADKVSYNLDITLPCIDVIYSLGYISNETDDTMQDQLIAAVTPVAYGFSDQEDYATTNIYSSILEHKDGFHVNVTKTEASTDTE